jgi:hypothetical protein
MVSTRFSCKIEVSTAKIRFMTRKVFLGIRINPELKKTLEQVADAEERSVAQICELLLRTGIDAYKKNGTKYLQRSMIRQKNQRSSE